MSITVIGGNKYLHRYVYYTLLNRHKLRLVNDKCIDDDDDDSPRNGELMKSRSEALSTSQSVDIHSILSLII